MNSTTNVIKRMIDLAHQCVSFHSRKSAQPPVVTDDFAKCAVQAHGICLKDNKS